MHGRETLSGGSSLLFLLASPDERYGDLQNFTDMDASPSGDVVLWYESVSDEALLGTWLRETAEAPNAR